MYTPVKPKPSLQGKTAYSGSKYELIRKMITGLSVFCTGRGSRVKFASRGQIARVKKNCAARTQLSRVPEEDLSYTDGNKEQSNWIQQRSCSNSGSIGTQDGPCITWRKTIKSGDGLFYTSYYCRKRKSGFRDGYLKNSWKL